MLFAFRELAQRAQEELAAIITSEHGKVLSDALGEVARARRSSNSLAASRICSRRDDRERSTNVDVASIRQPLSGRWPSSRPFNFPAMVPMWFFPIAIATGNTVVLKPSEKDPSAALWIANLWAEAGLPDGVFNVLQGDKVAVDELLTNPAIKAVSFVGSTPIAQYVYSTAPHGQARSGPRRREEPRRRLPDADLDLAADAMVNAGFGSAGERCMAISACVAVGDIADDLGRQDRRARRDLKTGDGTRGSRHGPAGHPGAPGQGLVLYIDAGERADGATIVVDGRNVVEADGGPTVWLGPTLSTTSPRHERLHDEIFGPVLSVIRVEDHLRRGSRPHQLQPFGNGTAIFTNDGGAARRFQNEVEVGMVGINVPIPVPTAYYSFGGWKSSLFGDTHAHGAEGVHFFTRGKVGDDPLARPLPRRHQPRFPAEQLTGRVTNA